MNIGIRLHDTAPGTLRERLGFARDQGFTCTHLALSKAMDGFRMDDAPALLTDALAEEVRGALEETGIECAVLGCYLNLADPDGERRRHTQEIYQAHLAFAKKIGARMVGTETYANPESRFTTAASESEEAYRLFLEGLRPVARFAEEADAVLAVEPVSYHIISTPERAERMLNDIGSDHVKIILDAVNLLVPGQEELAEERVADAIRRLGDRIIMLHMKDYIPLEGKTKSVACGTGHMRYEQLLRFARERNLPMTLEDTVPENAEQARLCLERIGAAL